MCLTFPPRPLRVLGPQTGVFSTLMTRPKWSVFSIPCGHLRWVKDGCKVSATRPVKG